MMGVPFHSPEFEGVAWVPANRPRSHRDRCYDPSKPAGWDSEFTLGSVPSAREFWRQLFYGNPWREPEEFLGLAEMYGSLDRDAAQSAANVIDGGGRYKLTSVYLVVWDEPRVCVPFQYDAPGKLAAGLFVKDWRFVVRIANVCAGTDLIRLMSRAVMMVPGLSAGATYYLREDVWEHICGQTALNRYLLRFRGLNVSRVPLRDDEGRVG